MEAVDQELMRHSPQQTESNAIALSSAPESYRTPMGQQETSTLRPLAQHRRRYSDSLPRPSRRNKSYKKPLINKQLLPGDPYKAYYVHANNIRQYMPKIEDRTLDAMIALRMRSNGHSKEAITKAITRMISVARMTWDNQKHAESVADFTFGLQGTHDMMRNKPYWPLWRKVEGVEEEQRQRE